MQTICAGSHFFERGQARSTGHLNVFPMLLAQIVGCTFDCRATTVARRIAPGPRETHDFRREASTNWLWINVVKQYDRQSRRVRDQQAVRQAVVDQMSER